MKFAEPEDVSARYEGTIPEDRGEWIELCIGDIEAELMGKVPSLRKSIDEINAESAAAGDPDRLDRVKALVCRKVLDLFRNPDGAIQKSQTMGEVSQSSSWWRGSPSRGGAAGGPVAFTVDDLDGVRLKRTRSRFGVATVAPWQVGG